MQFLYAKLGHLEEHPRQVSKNLTSGLGGDAITRNCLCTDAGQYPLRDKNSASKACKQSPPMQTISMKGQSQVFKGNIKVSSAIFVQRVINALYHMGATDSFFIFHKKTYVVDNH